MEKISKGLFWCFILGYGLMFLWIGLDLFVGDFLYTLHTKVFALEISKGTYMLLNFCGMGLWEMGVLLLFFTPWLAIKIVGKISR